MRRFLWRIYTQLYPWYLRKVFGMNIGCGCRIASSVHLDKSVNPRGIHIGDRTWLLRDSMILTHDNCRNLRADTRVGHDSIIGIRSIIMPGVTIGNSVVIGAGSIVTKSIPDNCMAVGSPARIIREGILVANGKIIENGKAVS